MLPIASSRRGSTPPPSSSWSSSGCPVIATPSLLASFLPPPLPRLSPTVATLGRSPWGLVVVEETLAGYNPLAVCTDKVFSLLSPHVFSSVSCARCAVGPIPEGLGVLDCFSGSREDIFLCYWLFGIKVFFTL